MKVLCVSMIGSPKPTSYESPMPPDVNLEASMRSRNDQMAAGTQRDLIEAGLSETRGMAVRLWGLCLWRRVRDAASAEAWEDLDRRGVIAGVDCSRQIDARHAVLGSTAGMVVRPRIGAVPANAIILAGATDVRWQKGGAAKPRSR
jgi:hypothetical protein